MRTLPVSNEFVKFSNAFRADEGAQKTSVTEVIEANKKEQKNGKTGQIVTSALAIAALVGSGIAIARNPRKSEEATEKAKKAAKEAIEKMEKELLTLKTTYEAKIEGLESRLLEAERSNNTELVNQLQGELQTVRSQLYPLKDKISELRRLSGVPFPEWVNINNAWFNVASIFGGSKIGGAAKADLENTLRTEAVKRMAGIGAGLENVPEGASIIHVLTSEFKGINSTGGMAIVPKEEVENLTKRLDAEFNVFMPLYRGAIDKKGTIRYLKQCANGDTLLMESVNGTEKQVLKLNKVFTKKHKYITDSLPVEAEINYYKSELSLELEGFNDMLNKFPESVQEAVKNMNIGERKQIGSLTVLKNSEGQVIATKKYNVILMDSGERGVFDLNVAKDKASSIYTDNSLSAAQTERQVLANKFYYDLISSEETPKELSAPDMIMGNDWQSGAAVAMLRLLTKAKEAYGELTPKMAKKLYNMPFVMDLHNADLCGNVWHSQEKLYNIMFGEYAGTILPNAHIRLSVPAEDSIMKNLGKDVNIPGLPSQIWNGLAHGSGSPGEVNFDPQMMALAYADGIFGVSGGYVNEISTLKFYGGEYKTQLYAFRRRANEYSDPRVVKAIVEYNGFKGPEVDKILKEPTLIKKLNGCDTANNRLTPKKVKALEDTLAEAYPEIWAKVGTHFTPFTPDIDPIEFHSKNAGVARNVIKEFVNEAKQAAPETIEFKVGDAEYKYDTYGKFKILLSDLTDLSNVTDKTPWYAYAGRISGQKGNDILANGLLKFYRECAAKGREFPVVIIKGSGDNKLIYEAAEAKKAVAKEFGVEAANRIVITTTFDEAGTYDVVRLATDFIMMPSWFEPCGLVHKEAGLYSGSIGVVNSTGGLPEDLEEGVNVIVSKYIPDRGKLQENSDYYVDAMHRAYDLFLDKERYAKSVDAMINADLNWAKEGGPIDVSVDWMKKHKIIDDSKIIK